MSLQPLEWRKLPTRIFPTNMTATSSYFLDTIYDMLTGSFYSDGSTRVIGSGSAWQTPTKFVTGSNTEAVYVFPGFQTVISQSIIFASKNTTGAVSSGTPPTLFGSRASSAGTPAITIGTGNLYAALVKNASGSFTQWTSRHPFGSGSYSMGYTAMTALPAGLDKLVIYESKEAIAVVTQTAAQDAQIFIAGAIIDPEQTTTSIDAEIDNRLYGCVASANLVQAYQNVFIPISSTFLTTSTGTAYNNFLEHLADYDGNSAVGAFNKASKFVMLQPQTTSSFGTNIEKFSNNTFATPNPIDINIETPLKCYATTLSNNFVGRLRDIVAIKNRTNNETLRDPNNRIVGYTISKNETSQNHAVCLKY